MTNDEAIEVLRTIEVCSFKDKSKKYFFKDVTDALVMAIDALEVEPLTDREQRIFLKAMSREREICKQLDAEYNDKNTTVSLVKVCNEIERKVKKIWE